MKKTNIISLALTMATITTFVSCQKSEEEYGDTNLGNDGSIPIAFWTDNQVNGNMKLYVNDQFVNDLQTTIHPNSAYVTCGDTGITWCYLPGDHYTIKVTDDEGSIFLEAEVGFSACRGSIGIVSISKGDLWMPLDDSNSNGLLGNCGRFNQIELIW